MTWIRNAVMTIGVLLVTAVPARADLSYYIAPMYGMTTGGLVGGTAKLTFGAQAGVLTGGMSGFEFDFGITKKTGKDTAADFRTLSGTFLFSLAGSNATMRPYLAAGAGIMQAVDDRKTIYGFGTNAVSRTNVINAGGGLFLMITGHFGVRVDARYFRALVDQQTAPGSTKTAPPHFIRAGVGLVVEF